MASPGRVTATRTILDPDLARRMGSPIRVNLGAVGMLEFSPFPRTDPLSPAEYERVLQFPEGNVGRYTASELDLYFTLAPDPMAEVRRIEDPPTPEAPTSPVAAPEPEPAETTSATSPADATSGNVEPAQPNADDPRLSGGHLADPRALL